MYTYIYVYKNNVYIYICIYNPICIPYVVGKIQIYQCLPSHRHHCTNYISWFRPDHAEPDGITCKATSHLIYEINLIIMGCFELKQDGVFQYVAKSFIGCFMELQYLVFRLFWWEVCPCQQDQWSQATKVLGDHHHHPNLF